MAFTDDAGGKTMSNATSPSEAENKNLLPAISELWPSRPEVSHRVVGVVKVALAVVAGWCSTVLVIARQRNQRVSILLLVLGLAVLTVVFLLTSAPNGKSMQEKAQSAKVRGDDSSKLKSALDMKSVPKKKINPLELRENFEKGRASLYERLSIDYGEQYFNAMFFSHPGEGKDPISRGRFVLKGPHNAHPGISWNRTRDRIVLKVLEKQLLQAVEDDANGSVPFIWASGGHSGAAGHGNLYNESYTAVMEGATRGVFASVGLDFVGRNYAMGGGTSSPEMAFCVDQVYGTDIDVLSWDFGMTDGRDGSAMQAYMLRAGRNPGRPALVGIGLPVHGGYPQALRQLEVLGLSTLQTDLNVFNEAHSAVPDSQELSGDQLLALPPFVRNFKCGDAIEKGLPHCEDEKFNNNVCPNRKGRVKWHPGWKAHAVTGNLLALFLTEILGDALNEIAAENVTTTEDAMRLSSQLKGKQNEDYRTFFESDLPAIAQRDWPKKGRNRLPIDPGLRKVLLAEPNVCHTAKVPAEIRFKGILTESEKIGFDSYDVGVTNSRAETSPDPADPAMSLVYKPAERPECPVVRLQVDFKDYFYASVIDNGWKEVRIPNDAEVREYGIIKPLRGVVAFCSTVCEWKCPPDWVEPNGRFLAYADIQVNGEPATSIIELGRKCALLAKSGTSSSTGTGENSINGTTTTTATNPDDYYFRPDERGRLVIRARVKQADAALYFSSFIAW